MYLAVPLPLSDHAAVRALAPPPLLASDAAARIADPAGYQTTLRRVAALLSPDQSVLEIGCGTGTTALRVAPFTRRLLATDVSPAMVAIASKLTELELKAVSAYISTLD